MITPLLLAAAAQALSPSLGPSDHREHRARLASAIENGVVWLEGAKEDDDARFLQDPDFWWLSGVTAPDAALLLTIKSGRITKETLYLQPRNALNERWNGPRLGPDDRDAARQTGFSEVVALDKESRAAALKINARAADGGHTNGDSAFRRILDRLQVSKSPAEMAIQEHVLEVTMDSHLEAWKEVRPDNGEWQVEAAMEAGFRKRGSHDTAFASIVGSGPNTCYLHYRANERQMKAGELVVIDVGAQFNYYCADITRTVPVSGRFNKRQAEIYEIVLEAQQKAIDAVRPGITMRDVHKVAADHIASKGYSKNFVHSTSHWLGLLVHDTGTFRGVLEPGMVLTVEPGIYIPEEDLGVRIEDVVVVTKEGGRLLTARLPRTIKELEAALRR